MVNLDPELQHVCVMGTLRSGKTLIGRALNVHPSMSVQNEPFFFFFKMCRNIFHRDILKEDIDFNGPMSPDFCVPSKMRKLFIQSFPHLLFNSDDIQTLKHLTEKQQKSLGEERAPATIPFLHLLKEGNAEEVLGDLMSILAHTYPKKNLRYVGFTEGWCEEFIGPLSNMNCSKFRCIHAIRDPRAVIASRNAGKNLKDDYGGKYPILFLIRHWRKSVAHSITNALNPHYLAVKYEDLIMSPREWFEKICCHLDLPFDDTIMHPEKYVNGCGKPWKQNTSFEPGDCFSAS